MDTPPGLPQTGLTKVKESITFKVVVIGLLVLLLLIPAGMVRSLIWERERRQADVVREISSKWGNEQVVAGPVLSLPYERTLKGPENKPVTYTAYVHVLPDQLDISGDIQPEIRYRGMYEAVLYNTVLSLKGSFSMPDLKALGVSPRDIRWDRAFLSVGVPDMKGLKETIGLKLNGVETIMNPGIASPDVLGAGLSSAIPDLRREEKLSFDLRLNLNGSQWLGFVPVGKVTTLALSSSWTNPSFDGAFLPEKREVGPKGFSATWKVLHLNRNYPQAWIGGEQKINGSAFGVKLVIPVDAYQKSTRTVKYALLFVALTFMAFFFSETMNKVRLHPFQYLLIGLALIVFYTLLISISEHLSFGKGYLISSVATILLITGYARGILGKASLAVAVCGVLTVLYGYLYILLQLEDLALLLGSIGLFVILAIVMYLTRKINWHTPAS